MKKLLSLLAFCTFISPFSGGEAMSIMDFVKKEKKQEIQEEETLHSAALDIWKGNVIALAENWKLSSAACSDFIYEDQKDFCKDQLLEQKKDIAERQNILNRQKRFLLSHDYCMERRSFENHSLCLRLLSSQEERCSLQETSGDKIIIDLQKQLLYAVKDCKLVAYTRITSGKDETPTPTGKWRIYEARGPHYMQDEWYVEKAFYFYGGYAVHDANWRTGSAWRVDRRGLNGSHGCINTPAPVMSVLWSEYDIFDEVEVYDSLPWRVQWELSAKVSGVSPYNPVGQ